MSRILFTGGVSAPGGCLLPGGVWWRPPLGRLLLREVRILLKCILVPIFSLFSRIIIPPQKSQRCRRRVWKSHVMSLKCPLHILICKENIKWNHCHPTVALVNELFVNIKYNFRRTWEHFLRSNLMDFLLQKQMEN